MRAIKIVAAIYGAFTFTEIIKHVLICVNTYLNAKKIASFKIKLPNNTKLLNICDSFPTTGTWFLRFKTSSSILQTETEISTECNVLMQKLR